MGQRYKKIYEEFIYSPRYLSVLASGMTAVAAVVFSVQQDWSLHSGIVCSVIAFSVQLWERKQQLRELAEAQDETEEDRKIRRSSLYETYIEKEIESWHKHGRKGLYLMTVDIPNADKIGLFKVAYVRYKRSEFDAPYSDELNPFINGEIRG